MPSRANPWQGPSGLRCPLPLSPKEQKRCQMVFGQKSAQPFFPGPHVPKDFTKSGRLKTVLTTSFLSLGRLDSFHLDFLHVTQRAGQTGQPYVFRMHKT